MQKATKVTLGAKPAGKTKKNLKKQNSKIVTFKDISEVRPGK